MEIAVYGLGFYELSRMRMKNVNNDVSKDSPIGQLKFSGKASEHIKLLLACTNVPFKG